MKLCYHFKFTYMEYPSKRKMGEHIATFLLFKDDVCLWNGNVCLRKLAYVR